MNKTLLLLIITAVVILTWLASSMWNVKKAQKRVGVLYSPNKSKSVELIKKYNSTQIMLNFHETLLVSGSNVASGNFDINDIGLSWYDENTLMIKYPKETKFNSKENQIYFLGDFVDVQYKEIE